MRISANIVVFVFSMSMVIICMKVLVVNQRLLYETNKWTKTMTTMITKVRVKRAIVWGIRNVTRIIRLK